MKGLKQYLKKHGAHFTEELTRDIIPIRWSIGTIEASIKDEVWFNCWSSTKGDRFYLVNLVAFIFPNQSKRYCIDFMLEKMSDYSYKKLFEFWAFSVDKDGNEALEDITPYI